MKRDTRTRQKPKGKTLCEVFAEEEARAKAENSTCKSGIYGAIHKGMNEPMSKKEELAVLDRAIAELGKDSYLGGWLKSVRGEVEAAIRSDIMPDVVGISIERSKAVCDAMLLEAAKEAEAIRCRSNADFNAALVEIRRHREAAAAEVRKALKALEA